MEVGSMRGAAHPEAARIMAVTGSQSSSLFTTHL